MFTFKPLEKSDFPLLHKWLNVDFVTKWYAKRKFAYDDVEKKYSKYVDGTVPTKSLVVYLENDPIGYIQTYRIRDYPTYAACVEMSKGTAGVDMFIGDKKYVGRGYGPLMIKQFLNEQVFTEYGIDGCIVGPEPDNKAAIRAYEKAGFKYLKTVQCPDEKDPEYIMLKLKKPYERVLYVAET